MFGGLFGSKRAPRRAARTKRKASKDQRKVDKRQSKDQRKVEKRQSKDQRKVDKRQSKDQRKVDKRQIKADVQNNRIANGVSGGHVAKNIANNVTELGMALGPQALAMLGASAPPVNPTTQTKNSGQTADDNEWDTPTVVAIAAAGVGTVVAVGAAVVAATR